MHVEFVWNKEQYFGLVESCKDNPTTPYIFKYLPKDKPVLEAGCGIGHYVKYLSSMSYDMYGIEVGRNAVDAVHDLDHTLKITCDTIERLPFPEGFFGGVMCLGVVEHLTEGPEKALAEIYRVMQPGATAIISVPVFNTLRKIKYYTGISFAEYYFRKIYHVLSGKKMDWLYKNTVKIDRPKYHRWPCVGGFFEYRFTKKQISQKLRDAHFEFVEEVSLEGLEGLYHELSGRLVNLSKPSRFVLYLDKIFSRVPFTHNHTYLAVVRKPKI